MKPKPNVVLIVADQLHYRHLGCMAHIAVKTPNIDRLAAEGALFENAICQAPLCMPSRASFNTGMYPHSCRARHNPVELLPEFETMAEMLREAGYRTGGFGHIGGDGAERGFEQKTDFPDEPIRSAYMREQEWVLANGGKPAGYCGTHPAPAEETFDGLVARLGCEFIRVTNEPFYLQVDFMDPHIPLLVPKPYASMVDPADIQLPVTWRSGLEGKPSNVRATRRATLMQDVSEEELRRSLAHYCGEICFVDKLVGDLVDTLREKDCLDDTLIIFTSDHGDYAGEFGIIGKTGQFYECLVHVPLIIRGCGIPVGRRIPALVELVDLVPTVLDACGQVAPAHVQGRTRWGLARGDTESGAACVFSQNSGGGAEPCSFDHPWPESALHPLPTDPYSSGPASHPMHGVMVRSGSHKLTVYADGSLELYNLAADPWEDHNIARAPEKQAVVLTLMQELLSWQMRTWLPDRPQQPLPYHYRSCSLESLPAECREARAAWDRRRD